jgi:clan AA aspartic protease
MLVDTGATHSVVPEDLARRLGLVALPRRVRVQLADGTRRAMPLAAMIVRLLGREAGDTALIGRQGIEPVLGVEALEALGLTVDPRSRRLRPTRARAVLLVSARTLRARR